MTANPDRLYELLPVVYRLRDADQGYPLRAMMQVISEQVNLVEADIAQLYENWFIETCEDWVVPYIGALLGYTPLTNSQDLANPAKPRGLAENRLLIPRQEVANTIGYRRRKGTLSVLEDLAAAVGGWPAHAVEFYRQLAVTQNINFLHLKRGRTVDVRHGSALNNLNGPFDRLAHTADIRRIQSKRGRGRFNIPEIGVFVWRIKSYTVTQTPAYATEEVSAQSYQFSVLGNDVQLFNNPISGQGTSELNYPGSITRRSFHDLKESSFYGDGRSLEIFTGPTRDVVPANQITAADLTDWKYRPLPNTVAVDPVLGRITFPPGTTRKQGVWVSYCYGFSADIGGGEYNRTLSQPSGATVYQVGLTQKLQRISEALAQWTKEAPQDAVIEITDSGAYVEPIDIALKARQTLQIRAANRTRPIIRLLDWQTSQPNDLRVAGEAGSWFTLDGLLITGRGVQVNPDLAGVTIRHCTLVPGWGVECDCEPKRPAEPSLELINSPGCLTIEHSIVGAIQVDRDETAEDPLLIHISDSIVDATSEDRIALGAPESLCAYSNLSIVRSTVFGQIETNALTLGENCIFMGTVLACRRQQGCVRFCYVAPGSRTPRRYKCQPDLVDEAVNALFRKGDITASDRDTLRQSERLRVQPEFNSIRYGSAAYCQLAAVCACEVKRGASDESEMGVFHDLYQAQRAANLATRLTEFSPAGMDAGIIYVS
jgi:hypothetical protein